MVKMTATLGVICSLGLFLLGATGLSSPGIKYLENRFALLWLALSLLSLIGFGVELWQENRLVAIRREWRLKPATRRRSRARAYRPVPGPERRRRSD
ncbi:MAG: hypothetical protein GX973_03530, partial [Firmicutes bacterium]|nr:hypothetical protein [Bacillota bacterium]